MNQPSSTEYPASSQMAHYIALVPDANVLEVLQHQYEEVLHRYESLLLPEQADFRYAEGKWTIKEMLGHMMDTERVFSYRALAIARGETQKLPGFEQDEYMAVAQFSRQPLEDLLQQYQFLRKGNLLLFRSFSEEDLSRMGTSSGSPLSSRALIYMIAGHERHHLNILSERYQLG
ncbi:DinB family protein [Siphonobacter sp.]|uniref:DinB family protein n=1 Tax=Siphonobacter sp. TaxID=1869184 RepID=UPI003B3AE666